MNSDIKNITALGLLLMLAFMMPSYREAVVGSSFSFGIDNAAAVITSVQPTPQPISSVSDNIKKCRRGMGCVLNHPPQTDVSVDVGSKPKLKLTYDSNKKEALLTSNFELNIDGGKNGVTILQYSGINFIDSTGQAVGANSYQNNPMISDDRRAATSTDVFGDPTFVIPPHEHAKFTATASIDPNQIFGGIYYASLVRITGIGSSTTYPWYDITVDPNKTNSVTIVGETGPYISNITPYTANVGDKVVISGLKMNGAMPYIDGVVSTSSFISLSSDGTSMIIKVPNLTAGWHMLSVGNSVGMSNGVGLNVSVSVSQTSVTASLDPSSPLTSTVQISKTSVTQNIPLAVFDLNAQSTSTLTGFSVNIGFNPVNTSPVPATSTGLATTLNGVFTNIFVKINGQTYAESSLIGNTVSFAIPSIGLPSNTSIPVTVLVSIAADSNGSLNGSSAFVTLPLSGIKVVDYLGNQEAVNQGNVAGILSGSSINFSDSDVVISNISVTYGNLISSPNATTTTQQFTMSFAITAGNNPIFISKNAGNALTASITAATQNPVNIGTLSFSDSDSTNDGSSYFYIAPGQTKTFNSIYSATGMDGSSAIFKVSAINFGSSSTVLGDRSISGTPIQNLQAILFH